MTRDFCALHVAEFTKLFTQVMRLTREMGLVKLGTAAIDGTKIKANASRHKAMSYGRMQIAEAELKAQIADLIKKAAATDEAARVRQDRFGCAAVWPAPALATGPPSLS